MDGWLTSCSDKGTFFSGMRCIPAVAQPTEAARTIAVFIVADGQRNLMGEREMQAIEDGWRVDEWSGCGVGVRWQALG